MRALVNVACEEQRAEVVDVEVFRVVLHGEGVFLGDGDLDGVVDGDREGRRDAGGEILVVSQFTLMASTKKGNRPSYVHAAPHEIAIPLYEKFCRDLSEAIGKPVGTGEFGADMQVALVNDGPVTICMDSKNR